MVATVYIGSGLFDVDGSDGMSAASELGLVAAVADDRASAVHRHASLRHHQSAPPDADDSTESTSAYRFIGGKGRCLNASIVADAPVASYDMIDPSQIAGQLPPVIRPLPETPRDPQNVVSHSLDLIVDVKERMNDADKMGVFSAVEKQQLEVELDIVSRQIQASTTIIPQYCFVLYATVPFSTKIMISSSANN